MAWSELAWQRHLRLSQMSTRSCSNSADHFRFYWISHGNIVVMNQTTGECRETAITREEESKLLYSHSVETGFHIVLFQRGTPYDG